MKTQRKGDRSLFSVEWIRSLLVIVFMSCSYPLFATTYLPADTSERLYIHDIKFEGSDVHINGNYQYILQAFVEYLSKHSDVHVHIRGHVCCRSGQRISRRRARNVYRYLKRSGIDKARLSYKGYSDMIPLAYPERTDEDERRNRRVDFILSNKPVDLK